MYQFIPYLIMAAAAGLQYDTQRRAAASQDAAARQANERRTIMSNQASDAAVKKTQEFAPDARKEQQDVIQQDLNTQFDAATKGPQLTAQGVEVGGGSGQIGANSTEFLKSKAEQQARASESVRELARLMSRTGSAGQLRRNEAVGIGDTADQIGRISRGINVMSEIDAQGIHAAGRPNGGRMLLGSLLQTAGSAYGSAGSGGGMTEATRTGRLPGAT